MRRAVELRSGVSRRLLGFQNERKTRNLAGHNAKRDEPGGERLSMGTSAIERLGRRTPVAG